MTSQALYLSFLAHIFDFTDRPMFVSNESWIKIKLQK